MPADAQRLDEGGDVEGDVGGEGEDVARGQGHGVGEAATPAGQADEAAAVADVLEAAAAGAAGAVVDGGLDGGGLADVEAGHAFADLEDCAGELVAEGDGYGLLGYGVGFEGGEGGPSEVFVEVWRG